RYFEAHFQRRLDRSREIGAPLSVLIFDIDDFKLVNDRFGHQTGDETLRRFAAVLSQEVRAADLVARFGGDEFVVVMSDATETQARTAADRLRARIARETSASVHLSASVGIAEAVQTDLRAEDVFSRADAALMASKSRRREEAERA
ncbi:MAG: GGDEF domain-containing protein, partial [Pseudomonadota bacterium]